MSEATTCDPDCAERTACPRVGDVGHMLCGRCERRDVPRHHCGCLSLRHVPRVQDGLQEDET